MVQVSGVFCGYCHRRYVAHLCRYGMPCEHEYAEPVRNGIKSPATLIQCFSWSYSEGFQAFELQRIHFSLVDDRMTKEYGTEFKAKHVNGDELTERFLNFLKKEIQLHEWPVWVEAFVSLMLGGRSVAMIPAWRLKQLQTKRKR